MTSPRADTQETILIPLVGSFQWSFFSIYSHAPVIAKHQRRYNMGLLIWDKSPEEALVLVIKEFKTFSAHNNLPKDESMTAIDLTDQSECRTAPSDATLSRRPAQGRLPFLQGLYSLKSCQRRQFKKKKMRGHN